MCNIEISDLIALLEIYTPDAVEIVKSAYEYAKLSHKDQYRQSGEPYITHPLSVAYILAEMHADSDTICAALLHDVLEDTNVTKEEIIKNFNITIANLVEGVTKISKLNASSRNEEIVANTRKIIVGITEDVRIIIIKLADRLHNMRTLEFKSEFKQKENALETMGIYVPLAYYIGAYRIKSELEDLSLRYLKPDTYKSIEEQKLKLEEENHDCLEEMLIKIKMILSSKNISNEIKLRTKNIYRIYKKLNEGLKTSDIHDLFALKIMVREIDDCYRVLGLVHSIYYPINDKFKDYICNPKTNMYQSLHTTVFGPNERLVQTQIRTFDMDNVASFGLTTYWNIDSCDTRITMQKSLREKFQFFRSLTEINLMFCDNKEFVQQVKFELFSDNIYVYTTKGDRIELPIGSTVIDFAYKIHTQVGNTMVGVFVNDELVPVDYVLHNKDRVRIITDELSKGPSMDWIDKAQTARAKTKIKEFHKK